MHDNIISMLNKLSCPPHPIRRENRRRAAGCRVMSMQSSKFLFTRTLSSDLESNALTLVHQQDYWSGVVYNGLVWDDQFSVVVEKHRAADMHLTRRHYTISNMNNVMQRCTSLTSMCAFFYFLYFTCENQFLHFPTASCQLATFDIPSWTIFQQNLFQPLACFVPWTNQIHRSCLPWTEACHQWCHNRMKMSMELSRVTTVWQY